MVLNIASASARRRGLYIVPGHLWQAVLMLKSIEDSRRVQDQRSWRIELTICAKQEGMIREGIE
jgi:hypothetical protein